MPITRDDLTNWFTYHAATPEQAKHYEALRAAAKVFAEAILEYTPSSPDQTVAIRKTREAVMIAIASIACGGK